MKNDPVIRAEALTRRFSSRVGLKPISFEASGGEAIALMGPNASGKSTLLRLLAGLIAPSEGTVTVFGKSPRREPAIRKRLGFLGHDLGLYPELSARENLLFYAGLFFLDNARAVVDAALDSFHLLDRADDRVSGFSRGMKERLALARIALHQPDLFLLDEPTTGLDTASTEELVRRIREWTSRGALVLLSTHDAAVRESLGARVVRLDR